MREQRQVPWIRNGVATWSGAVYVYDSRKSRPRRLEERPPVTPLADEAEAPPLASGVEQQGGELSPTIETRHPGRLQIRALPSTSPEVGGGQPEPLGTVLASQAGPTGMPSGDPTAGWPVTTWQELPRGGGPAAPSEGGWAVEFGTGRRVRLRNGRPLAE
jgi:hypothetical protein